MDQYARFEIRVVANGYTINPYGDPQPLYVFNSFDEVCEWLKKHLTQPGSLPEWTQVLREDAANP